MRLPWEIPALAFAAIVAASCSSLAVLPAPSLCPAPKAYTAAEEARAARELVALPAGAMLAQMIADYGRERAELRACRR